jgi:membrane protease YdiL (CAAX protease family)
MSETEHGLAVPAQVGASVTARRPVPAPAGPLSPPPAGSGGGPFLDTPSIPPRTRTQAWIWVVFALAGFLVGQIGAAVFGQVAGTIAGKSSAQMSSIVSAAVPPEWYVVATLMGLWIGFLGAPWLASRIQGTRHFIADLGLRFRWVDLAGLAIGVAWQYVVALMYQPFRHEIHDFNAPAQKLTSGSHGGGFALIVLVTVLIVPVMEELFFRGLLLKGLIRFCTPEAATPGRARAAAVVLAVVLDGVLFGLAHGEWVQLAGLASFGVVLAAVSYRTGRLGMNIVAHGAFNLVAVLSILQSGGGVVH